MADEQTLPVKTGTIGMGRTGIQIETMEDAFRFATAYFQSRMAPKGFESPQAVLIAMQMGAEIGLPWSAAVQNIAVINGRPSVWGDAALAVCQESPRFEDIDEYFDGDGDGLMAVCEVRVKGKAKPVLRSFSVDDAKKAGLWGKAGPWQQYPKRMLQMRARSWALKDAFPGALKGLYTAEEAQDIPPAERKTVENLTPPEPGKSRADAFLLKKGDKVADTPRPTGTLDTPAVAENPIHIEAAATVALDKGEYGTKRETPEQERDFLVDVISEEITRLGMDGPAFDRFIADLGLEQFNPDTADADLLNLVLDALKAKEVDDATQEMDFGPEPPDEALAPPEEEKAPPATLSTGITKKTSPAPSSQAAPAVSKARGRTMSAIMGIKLGKKVPGAKWNELLTAAGSTDYKIENLTDEQLESLLEAMEGLANA